MPRYARDTVLLAKIETTYGIDSVPTGASNAIAISAPRLTPIQANNVDRDLVRPFLGGSEQLVGTRYVMAEFTCELAGSGTAGDAPAYGPLLRACAMAETVTASTRVDYTPITNSQEAVTLYWNDSGVRHKMLGAKGTCTLAVNSGERPELRFQFTGLYVDPAAATESGVSFDAWITPLVVTDANSGDVTLGGTVASSGSPAISGGTAYPSLGLEIEQGHSVQHTPLLGGETVDVTQRAMGGRIRLDLTPAQEVTLYGNVLNATLSSVSMIHGTAAGNKVLLHAPSVQFYEPTKEDLNGRRLIGYRLRLVPTPAGTGNDEFRLVVF